jgi:hypothetical protein
MVGFTPVNPDQSPMVQYSNYHWHYALPQVMEPATSVNRRIAVPFSTPRRNVNVYRKGVWIDLDIDPVFRVALEPFLSKLPLTREVPQTTVQEAVRDFSSFSQYVKDERAKRAWLAKVIQLCALRKEPSVAIDLWNSHCSVFDRNVIPPVPLAKAFLFCLTNSDSAEWKMPFKQCLRDCWNLTPSFEAMQWNFLLRCAGRLGDDDGVKLILEEIVDVEAPLNRLDSNALAIALNAVVSEDNYNFVKKFLFSIDERRVSRLRAAYANLRAASDDAIKENDKMFYHVCWHESVRLPRRFSPRQQFFDHTVSALSRDSQSASAKVDAVVEDKIKKWKSEGLLPEDYESTTKVYDRSSAFKNIVRKEKWKTWEFTKKQFDGYTEM